MVSTTWALRLAGEAERSAARCFSASIQPDRRKRAGRWHAVSFYTAAESTGGNSAMPTRVLFVPALACAALLAAGAARPALPPVSIEHVLCAPLPSHLPAARQGEPVARLTDRHGRRNGCGAD